MLGASSARWPIVVWWLFFSRAPWLERVGAIVLMVVAVLATRTVVHESIAGAGQGMLMLHPAGAVPRPCARRVGGGHTSSSATAFGARRWSRRSCSLARRWRSSERWCQGRRRFGVPLAVDADSRATAAGPGDDEPKPLPPSRARRSPRRRRRFPQERRRPQRRGASGRLPRLQSRRRSKRRRSGGDGDTSRVARLSRARARQRHSRRADRDGLVESPPVAIWRRPIGPGWSSFAVQRRSPLYPGAAW